MQHSNADIVKAYHRQKSKKTRKGIQSNDTAEIVLKRQIEIKNMQEATCIEIAKETIMDVAAKHAKEEMINNDEMHLLNHAWLHKKMCLPCKLIGWNGKSRMKQFRCEHEKSCLR